MDNFLTKYRELLEAWDAAKKAELAARVDGNLDAIWQAGWEVTERMGAIQEHKKDEATYLAMQLRWLDELCPDAVGPIAALRQEIRDLRYEVRELQAALAEAVTS